MPQTLYRTLFFAALLLTVPLLGCSDEADLETTGEEMAGMRRVGAAAGASAPVAAPPPPPRPEQMERLSIGYSSAADADEQGAAPLPQALVVGGADTARAMIIRNGESFIQVDSLETAVAAIERAASALGGGIAHSSIQLGDRQWRTARLEVRFPAERWDELIVGLRRVGDLRQLTTSTEDVGEQFVDLTAQLSNARRLEARYLELLENRTGTLEDLLAVERELARVRERIERLQGRLRYLEERVAVSTMVVNLQEETDLLATSPGAEPIRDAFREAWRNFLAVITGGIALLGVVVPLSLVAAGAVWGWRLMRRRRLS